MQWLTRWPKPSCTQAAHFTHPPIKCHHEVCWPGGAGAHESQNLFPKVRWRNRRGSPRLIALLNKKISRCTQQSVIAVELPRLCKDLPRSSEGCQKTIFGPILGDSKANKPSPLRLDHFPVTVTFCIGLMIKLPLGSQLGQQAWGRCSSAWGNGFGHQTCPSQSSTA